MTAVGRAPVLVLTRCTLRPWQRGDEASLARHANNPRIWENLRDRFPHPYTAADAEAWIRTASAEAPITKLAVVVDGAAVGAVGFALGSDVHRRSAEIGYWLGEVFWGRGIATEAVRAATDYAFTAFSALGLCRVWAGVFDWNPASARVLEKAGYTFEGRLRMHVTKAGRTGDELVYAVVRP